MVKRENYINMETKHSIAQLLLRLALGIGFLLPVMDRLGWLGQPGDPGVGWGNWQHFVDYTHLLIPYVNLPMASFLGILATVAECVIAVLLIIGYKTRLAALGSFLLTLLFAISMLFFLNYRAPFNYSVFVVSFASLLLTKVESYTWSLDAYASRRKKNFSFI